VRDTIVVGEPRQIWGVLPAVFASLSVDAEMVDPTALAIGTQRRRTSRVDGTQLSRFLDCGGGVASPNADSYDVMLTLFVQLEAEGSGSTLVRTVLDATAQSRYNQSDQIQCASFGTLERRVVALIDEHLRPSPGVAGRGPRRSPVAGDFIRLTCAAGPGGTAAVSTGELLGIGEGAIAVTFEGRGEQTSVPVSSVLRLDIRERRSYARRSALVGAAAGIASGALLGRSSYDPDDRTHYQAGVYTTIGAVLGAVGGAALGGLVGSFLDHDTWVEGDLAIGTTRSEGDLAAPVMTSSCPTSAPTAQSRF